MKTVVIYNSQTGFTKRYAQWISEATGADCLELPNAKKKNLAAYDAIIYGGWACAGNISKLSWFKNNMGHWTDKKLIVFCVGASPITNPDVELFLKQKKAELKKVNVFYCPGGLNYERMSAPSRLMMKLFQKKLDTKKNKTVAEHEMIKMLSKSYDISEQKYIEPILKCLEPSNHSSLKA